MYRLRCFVAAICIAAALPLSAHAQDDETTTTPGKRQYSPYPEKNVPNQVFFGAALPTDVPASIQERAYTSPIWYTH